MVDSTAPVPRRRRRTLLIAIAALAAALIGALPAPLAHADPGSLTVDPAEGRSGTPFTVSGQGCGGDRVFVASGISGALPTPAGDGSWSAQLITPLGARHQAQNVYAACLQGDAIAFEYDPVTYTVTGTGPSGAQMTAVAVCEPAGTYRIDVTVTNGPDQPIDIVEGRLGWGSRLDDEVPGLVGPLAAGAARTGSLDTPWTNVTEGLYGAVRYRFGAGFEQQIGATIEWETPCIPTPTTTTTTATTNTLGAPPSPPPTTAPAARAQVTTASFTG